MNIKERGESVNKVQKEPKGYWKECQTIFLPKFVHSPKSTYLPLNQIL